MAPSMNGRDLLAAAGVVLATLGILIVVESRLGGLGLGEAAVILVGLLALLHGLWLVRERWDHEVDQAVTATPEEPLGAPTPGEEFDHTLGYRVEGEGQLPFRKRVTTRIREVTDDIAARTGEDAASLTALDDPDWQPPGRDAVGSFSDSVRDVFAGESAFQQRVREAVDALAVRAGLAEGYLPPVGRQPLPEDPVVERDRQRAAVETGADRRPPAGEVGELYSHERRETTRWRGVKAIALVSIGAGIISKQPAALLAGVAGFGFAGYVQSGSLGDVDVDVERRLSDTDPRPGDEVRVTVRVENVGEETLPDLRVVDGVPAALPVTRGSPRMGAALRPGKSAEFSYTTVARRGDHEFDPLTLIARDATGAVEEEFTYREESGLVCLPGMRAARAAPLRAQGTGFAGQVRADVGGGGTEFHTTREYRHGDPLNRIDWNRKASTGDLATMEFREERLAKVLLVVDARGDGRYAPPEATMTSLDRSVYAAGRLFTALLNGGNQVGVAAASPEATWLSTGAGDEHRARVRDRLARDPAFAPVGSEEEFYSLPWLRRLRGRLHGDAQVVVVSPLCDDLGELLPRWVEGYGFPVTVVSPDPTGERTTGQRLARLERSVRLTELRSRGIRVVDWDWEEPLDVALLRAQERWRSRG